MPKVFLTDCKTDELDVWSEHHRQEERSLTIVIDDCIYYGKFSGLVEHGYNFNSYFTELKCRQ